MILFPGARVVWGKVSSPCKEGDLLCEFYFIIYLAQFVHKGIKFFCWIRTMAECCFKKGIVLGDPILGQRDFIVSLHVHHFCCLSINPVAEKKDCCWYSGKGVDINRYWLKKKSVIVINTAFGLSIFLNIYFLDLENLRERFLLMRNCMGEGECKIMLHRE